MARGTLAVKVVSPESTVFSGDATGLIAPAWDGKVGILAGHAPMITLLGAGELTIAGPGGRRAYHVAGGLIKVEGDQVVVLTEYASDEPPPAELVRELMGAQANLEGTPSTASSASASA